MKNAITLALLMSVAASSSAFAEDEKASGTPTTAPTKKKSSSKEPDMGAMMAAYEKAGTPGEQHKFLHRMVGKWNATVKSWRGPGEPTSEPGTSETKLVLGDRFTQTTFTSTFMGKPFSGVGTTGYDNIRKKFVGTWMDNMSTGIMQIEGKLDADGNVLTSNAAHADPMTGKETRTRIVTRFESESSYVEEYWDKRGGKETKVMEITYTKVK